MMKKFPLTTHWRAEDAQLVLEFLDELREIISTAYGNELGALYESQQQAPEGDDTFDLFSDEIPF